jgi:hypothetical protein
MTRDRSDTPSLRARCAISESRSRTRWSCRSRPRREYCEGLPDLFEDRGEADPAHSLSMCQGDRRSSRMGGNLAFTMRASKSKAPQLGTLAARRRAITANPHSIADG